MAIQFIGNSGSPSALPAAPSTAAAPPPMSTRAGTPTPAPQPSEEQVQKAVDSVSQTVQLLVPNSLQFSVDEETGKTLVSVTDAETGEMIRQIPSKELVEIAKSLDKLQGLLLRQKA